MLGRNDSSNNADPHPSYTSKPAILGEADVGVSANYHVILDGDIK